MSQYQFQDAFIYSLYNEILQIEPTRPRGIALAGFPATGKTSIAESLAKLLGSSKSYIVPENAFILDRDSRLKNKISSCSPDSLKRQAYVEYVEHLFKERHSGGHLIYNHKKGEHTAYSPSVDLPEDTWIIIDGPRSCITEITEYCSMVVYFIPEPFREWIQYSVIRDITQRNYVKEEAIWNNKANIKDLCRVHIANRINITRTVDVAVSSNTMMYGPHNGEIDWRRLIGG